MLTPSIDVHVFVACGFWRDVSHQDQCGSGPRISLACSGNSRFVASTLCASQSVLYLWSRTPDVSGVHIYDWRYGYISFYAIIVVEREKCFCRLTPSTNPNRDCEKPPSHKFTCDIVHRCRYMYGSVEADIAQRQIS